MIFVGYLLGAGRVNLLSLEITHRTLTLEFLSTLHVDIIYGLDVNRRIFHFICRDNFMSELNVFNEIFGFPSSFDLSCL